MPVLHTGSTVPRILMAPGEKVFTILGPPNEILISSGGRAGGGWGEGREVDSAPSVVSQMDCEP